MKARINEMFQYPISKELENHILNDLGFKEEEHKKVQEMYKKIKEKYEKM